MKIGFAGAGAIACHYGSLLQLAGNKILYLARGPHLRAMQKDGLLHVSGGGSRKLSVQADDQPSILEEAEIIILSCKLNDLESLLSEVCSIIRQDTLVLTLQNGVEAPNIVSDILPGHAIAAGSAFIGARIDPPGTIIHSAAGGIRLGLWRPGSGGEKISVLVQALSDAGIPAREEKDVKRMLWRKLLWNCGFNAITAITRLYARDIAANKETLAIVRDAMREVVSVANRIDIAIGEEEIRKHIRTTLEMGPVKTSMWQDIEHGKLTEVDFINGLVVREAKAHRLDAPVNRMLTTLVHAVEHTQIDPKQQL
ncbi:MAG: ketopantoate reductase family protein [Mariprofundaceae bacterium]